MASGVEPAELPPPYEDEEDDVAKEILQPMILVLCGQAIHAESTETTPLYQLNRGIAGLSNATKEVEFQRVETSVKTVTGGVPIIKTRPRSLYTLRLVTGPLGALERVPSGSPRYLIKAVSRRAIGNVGLSKKHHFRSQWKAGPVVMTGNSKRLGNIPEFVKDAKPMFEIRQKDGRYEWVDSEENAVAVEDQGENQYRLIVTASLHRETMDALVALWCCRLWQHSAEHTERIHEGAAGVIRKLRLAHS